VCDVVFAFALNWFRQDRSSLTWFGHGWVLFLLVLAGCTLICGWLSARHGDRFWDRVVDCLSWWPY
jgi:hypothetical protein